MSSFDTWAFKLPLMLIAAAACVFTVASALTYK